MSHHPAGGRPAFRIWGLGDSTGCGHVSAGVTQPVAYNIGRGLEELRADPQRAPYHSKDAPWYQFVGGLTGDTAEFHESLRGFSAFLSGSTAEDILNGTGGHSTPAVALAAMLIKPTHCILSTGGNDFTSLNRSVATVLATLTAIIAAVRAASPTTRIVLCPPHRGFNPAAAHYQDILDLQTACTVQATGADVVMNAHYGSAYLDTMMVDSSADAHPKVEANPSLITTWRKILTPTTVGSHAYAMWLWDIIWAGYKRPILPGETWVN